jgi:hypothetical protein
MRYWFDTEFVEHGRTIDLMSIGIVSEDGREYYAESSECDYFGADSRTRSVVIPYLNGGQSQRSRSMIAVEVLEFIGNEGPEIWSYYGDYDWVVLCQLFGTTMQLPYEWPVNCLSIRQYAFMLGDPELPNQSGPTYDALAGARWTRETWYFLAEQHRKLIEQQ